MAEYRWNQAELAAGYDASAQHVHPHYEELQETILELLPPDGERPFLLVDLGGGSGRLAEKFLARRPPARAIVIDQSEAFLEIAARRMSPCGGRGSCLLSRLQDDWAARLPDAPGAIVSMSAIHHLLPDEKRALYRRCGEVLAPGGVLLNGDEVRPESDAAYLAECQAWAAHMRQIVEANLVPPPMCDALRRWEERNVAQFGQPRQSGDDCHETIATQLEYLRAAGFATADVPWQRKLWAVLRGVK